MANSNWAVPIAASALVALFWAGSADSVHARAELCNGGNTTLYLASVTSRDGPSWSAQGWTRIPAGTCRSGPDPGAADSEAPVYYGFGVETPAGGFAVPVGVGIGVSSVQRSGGISIASVTSANRRFCVDPHGDFRRSGTLDALASCGGQGGGWVPVAFSHAVVARGSGGHVTITISPRQSAAGSPITAPDGRPVPPPR